MLLVIIGLAIGLVYIFVDQSKIEQDGFDFNEWLKKKYKPGHNPEQEAEEELEDMLDNAEDYWKKFM